MALLSVDTGCDCVLSAEEFDPEWVSAPTYLVHAENRLFSRGGRMLSQVYRCGPTRQRILKGYVVAGEQPARIIDQVVGQVNRLPAAPSRPNLAPPDPRFSTVLWFDTGPIWLHTVRARQAHFFNLSAAIQIVSGLVKQAGGTLLPSATRLSNSHPWEHSVCGDQHFLETVDDIEKEVFCNLIRTHVPELIAFTGRSGAGPNGVEPLGSRRLIDSGHHYAARYLASVSPSHLQRVKDCLRRDEGVARLDLLDVYPVEAPPEMASWVELRFTDAQLLLATVRAEALLYEALLIRARRKVRDGRREWAVPQDLLEHNRARAVADGLQARLEITEQRRDLTRDVKGFRADGKRRFVLAREVLLSLLEDLQYEFRVLEVEYSEIAPLVLGPALREMGSPGLQNENELLRSLHRSCSQQKLDFVAQVARLVGHFSLDQQDPLTAANQKHFLIAARRIQHWWDHKLHIDRSVPVPPPRKAEKEQSRAPADQDARTRRDLADGPGKHSQGSSRLARAAGALCTDLRALGPEASVINKVKCLGKFREAADSADLDEALGGLSQEEAKTLRQLLLPRAKKPFVMGAIGRVWNDDAAQAALKEAQRDGLALVVYQGPTDQEQRMLSLAKQMDTKRPDGIDLYLWQIVSFQFQGRPTTNVELLMACRHPGGVS